MDDSSVCVYDSSRFPGYKWCDFGVPFFVDLWGVLMDDFSGDLGRFYGLLRGPGSFCGILVSK